MGQSKQRGTREQRILAAINRDSLVKAKRSGYSYGVLFIRAVFWLACLSGLYVWIK